MHDVSINSLFVPAPAIRLVPFSFPSSSSESTPSSLVSYSFLFINHILAPTLSALSTDTQLLMAVGRAGFREKGEKQAHLLLLLLLLLFLFLLAAAAVTAAV
jgi:hypothetical protein